MFDNGSHFCEILKLICINERISRKDLANKLNISGAAVTKITRVMLDEGMITESEELLELDKRSGRKSVSIRINPTYKYAIGVNIEADSTYIALCDLLARPVKNFSIKTRKDCSPDKFIAEVCLHIRGILSAYQLTCEDIVGIGVAIIGVVDFNLGISNDSFGIWERPIYLRNLFKQFFDIPVVVESNTQALATAGLLFGRERFCKNMLYVKWIPGVGGAAIIDGQVYLGPTFRGAELGHTYGDYSDIRCRCGRVGCLETILSIYALTDVVKKKFSKEETPNLYEMFDGDPERISVDNMTLWLNSGDEIIEHEIAARADKFATAISNMAIAFNSEKIIFYGQGFFASKSVYESIKHNVMKKCEWLSADDLMLTNFAEQYDYIGPVSIAIEKFFINNDLRNIK